MNDVHLDPVPPDCLLRDVFAGIAMHALIINMTNLRKGVSVSEESYRAADAMMAQRSIERAGEGAA